VIALRRTSVEKRANEGTKIAVLVPAHNEEDVIDRSLAWAIEEAGRENVYLVADACTDRTVRFASYWIGREHVHEVVRSGRGPAVMKAIRHFGLLERYDGVFMADADSLILPGALAEYSRMLTDGVAAVIGHVKVLREQNNLFASWRRYQYFWGFNLNVRAASFYGGCFPNTPGCCSVYSTQALRNIDHDPKTPAEDMDFCLQIHRKRLGRVLFTPRAWVETSDPLTFADYRKQCLRWGRAWWYNIRKHRIGLRLQPVDFMAGYFTLAMFANWARLAVVLVGAVCLLLGTSFWLFETVAFSFVLDAALMLGIGVVTAFRRKISVLRHLPLFPLMLAVDLGIYGYAFLTQRRGLSATWASPARVKGGE
jgi:cellulose synthase/poly-beta-1,6-N-acetylglucosamine synthase-like glycosyltransferase